MHATRLICLLIASLLLGGCNLDSAWEEWYKGTTKGFGYCKESAGKQNLSISAVVAFCADRHQKSLSGFFNGRARYDINYGNASFTGFLENRQVGVVVTQFSVTVRHKDSKDGEERKTFSGIWVEPNSLYNFTIVTRDLKFKPAAEQIKEDQFEWNIEDVRGVNIAL